MIQSLHLADSISGTIALPGDKSMSHRYAMLAAISEGVSRLAHFASSQDCHSTLGCLRSLGVGVSEAGETVTIQGRGLRGLQSPSVVLDAGNSGTTMRLLSGILAGHPFESTMAGDASLSRRPMGRVIRPLVSMGAQVDSQPGELPPLRIRGGALKAVRYELPVASAQVKSCVLLAGLYGDGLTSVKAVVPTRDHTEIALKEFGAAVRVAGDWIEVEPGPRLRGGEIEIPGDLSGAAFFLVAAALVPHADILIPRVGLNRRRRELLDYLQSAGMDITVENESEKLGEARGDLRVRFQEKLLHSRLQPIGGSLVAALIDEIPVLAILGSQIAGGLEISDAHELRIKESDRIAVLAANLRAMGVEVEEKPDGIRIPGCQRLRGSDIDTHGDHRIAMAFAIAGLVAHGETRIHQAECADVSFPGFWETLRKAQLRSQK
jgi:3-phosphoshikimate 1-carboxyvinyltransferase